MLARSSCAFCHVRFTPEEKQRGLRLHSDCIGPYAESCEARAERKKQAKAKQLKAQEARELRARKKAIEPIKKAKARAQAAFNAYIRERDRDLPCVSCGVTDPPMTPGGQWDAGHFLSRGAYRELRFHEDNCHKQCKRCNGGGGKFAHKERTVNAKYEEELVRRIGLERLAALKTPHPPIKMDAAGYDELAATYRAKRRELEKQRSEA